MATKTAEKQTRSDEIVDAINKVLGTNTIVRMGVAPMRTYDVISTGSIGLDRATGIGGFPRGRIVEIYGPESAGKSTLCLQVIAAAQRQGLLCAFIDAEHALDLKYAAALNVNIAELLVSQPDHGEQAIEVAQMLARTSTCGVIVVDSVAALVPKAELEGEAGDSHMGLQARLMGQAMRRLTGVVNTGNTLVIFTNQLRNKLGVTWGSNETTTGGNALKFYASMRVDVRRIGAVKQAEQHVGNRTRAKVVKNKLSPPFQEAEFDIEYGRGVSIEGELVELGVDVGLVEKSGAWFSLCLPEVDSVRMGQGLEAAKAFLRSNAEACASLTAAILAAPSIPRRTKERADG